MTNLGNIPSFRHTGFYSPITEFAVFLIGLNDDQYVVFGSGVIISPHIPITACHVIQDFIKHLENQSVVKYGSAVNCTFNLLAVHFTNGGAVAEAWEVRRIFLAHDLTDIAFLLLLPTRETQRDYSWRRLTLQLQPPAVGSHIAAFGYPTRGVVVLHDGVEISTSAFTSYGLVEEIYEKERDRCMFPFPCFRTNMHFAGAMSGGPVFTQNGLLCGIICASLHTDDESFPLSYVTTLWPSMAIRVSYDWPSGSDAQYPALELVHRGIIKAIDGESIFVNYDSAGNLAMGYKKET